VWQRTASISSLIANIYRDEKKRRKPYSHEDFNPIQMPGEPKKKTKKPTQTWQEQKQIIELYNVGLGGLDNRGKEV